MGEQVSASDDSKPDPVGEFVGRVRARFVVASLLGASAFAAVVNEALRWSSAAAVVYLGWRVPVFGFLGLLVLAALVLPTLRHWTPAAAAGRADTRLGLKDRLASWVDFRGRPEIPEAVKRAQARETVRALAGATPAAVAPIPLWRAAGPVLLAFCLLYEFFIPVNESDTSPLVNVIVPSWRIAPPSEVQPPARGDGAPPDGEPGAGRVTGKPLAEPAKPQEPQAANGTPQAETPAKLKGEADTKLAEGDARKSGDRTKPGDDGRAGQQEPREPERIESERVGTHIAKVVDPLFRAGNSQTAAAPPGGVATFHLLPQSGSAGVGGGPGGEAVAPVPVRVDLDAVLPPYRPIVKAYFDHLARAAAPAGVTEP